MPHHYAPGYACPIALRFPALILIMGTPTQEFFFYKVMQKEKNNLPPQKIAVLIDGGFFIKRFNIQYNKNGKMTAEDMANAMYTMAHQHVGKNNILYRIFYYDCKPLEKKFHNPISHKVVDFSKTKECLFRKNLFEELKKKRKVALRLGNVKDNRQWQIYSAKVKELLDGTIDIHSLTENDVYLNIRQKGIDMKIGVDIASLSLKRFVDTIVLFSGDADFVPAAKLARREGVDFILDPMNANVDPQLFEHIDGMKSVAPPGHKKRTKKN